MEFSLDNAVVQLDDGTLLRQTKGIPMGDPNSPGMTIGACGWMENEWMQTIGGDCKKYFRIKRFMVDICIVYNTSTPIRRSFRNEPR